MIAASSRVGFALGVLLEPDILGSPLYSMPRYHGARKAEHLGPSVALFKKRVCRFSWLSRGYLPMRAAKSSRFSSICRQQSSSDQRLGAPQGVGEEPALPY